LVALHSVDPHAVPKTSQLGADNGDLSAIEAGDEVSDLGMPKRSLAILEVVAQQSLVAFNGVVYQLCLTVGDARCIPTGSLGFEDLNSGLRKQKAGAIVEEATI
jgi:hypothetical protein